MYINFKKYIKKNRLVQVTLNHCGCELWVGPPIQRCFSIVNTQPAVVEFMHGC